MYGILLPLPFPTPVRCHPVVATDSPGKGVEGDQRKGGGGNHAERERERCRDHHTGVTLAVGRGVDMIVLFSRQIR